MKFIMLLSLLTVNSYAMTPCEEEVLTYLVTEESPAYREYMKALEVYGNDGGSDSSPGLKKMRLIFSTMQKLAEVSCFEIEESK